MTEYINADNVMDSIFVCFNEECEVKFVWDNTKPDERQYSFFEGDAADRIEDYLFSLSYLSERMGHSEEVIQKAIDSSIKRGLVEAIEEDGEIQYRLTKKGFEFVKSEENNLFGELDA